MEEKEILVDLKLNMEKLANEQEDIDPEILEVVEKRFWDLM